MKKILTYTTALIIVIGAVFPTAIFAENEELNIGQANPLPHPCVVINSALGQGSTDSTTNGQVSKVQYYLSTIGEISKTDVTGQFDTKTKEALKRLQQRKNVEAVGTVGPKTRKILGDACVSGTVSTTTVISGPGRTRRILNSTSTPTSSPARPSVISWIMNTFSPLPLLADVINSITGIFIGSNPVLVAQYDFEAAALTDGAYTNNQINNWTGVGYSTQDYQYGIYNPPSTSMTNAGGNVLPGTGNGAEYAYLYGNGYITPSKVPVANITEAGDIYTLTVATGWRNDMIAPSGALGIIVGSNLASLGFKNISQGTFVDNTISYTTKTEDIGKPLTLRLYSKYSPGAQTGFDNIRLTVQTNRPVPIPAPAPVTPPPTPTPTPLPTPIVATPPAVEAGSAIFVGIDATTQGSWMGIYGREGYSLLGDRSSLPSYTNTSVHSASTWTWTNSTTDTRGLQKISTGGSADRLVATWYTNPTPFYFDVNLTDHKPHQVALYAVDWDSTSRVERIDILDTRNNVLDSRTLTDFHQGKYISWNLNGHVKIRITALSGNGVVSGIFFGVKTAPVADTQAPVISITSPRTGNTVSSTVTINSQASDNVGVTKVDFYKNNTLFSSDTSAPYFASWNTSLESNNTFTWTAKAYDLSGNTSVSTGVDLTVRNVTPVVNLTAAFTSITYNTSATLIWSTTGATRCTASGDWTGAKAVSGSTSTGNLITSKTYTLACTNSAGTTSKTVVVTVGSAPLLPPTLSFSALGTTLTYNASTTLSWSAQNATSCRASDGWSGTRAISGSFSTGNLTVNKSYTLTCTGAGGRGSVVKSVLITVTAAPDIMAPTISITAPIDGATVSGLVTIIATASDNIGVSKVELYKDSVLLQSNTTAPYAFTWTTPVATASIQSFTFSEKAYDAVGNIGSSNSIKLNVAAVIIATTTPPIIPPPPTPTPAGIPVTVSVKNLISFNELYIEGSDADDSISISQSGSTVTVNGNGTTKSFTGPFGDIVIKGDGGVNTLNVDSSVTGRVLVYGRGSNDTITANGSAKVTAVTIGAGVANITGNGNTSYWVGAEDAVHATPAEISAGRVHKVTAFANYPSLELNGPNIPDPTDTSGSTVRVTNRSLWGQGPVASDINQGLLADCYFVATLDSFANANPTAFEEYAVDLGDGTYAVRFSRLGVNKYVRVDADLDFMFNNPGPTGNIWGMVYEKAFAYYRRGVNTYASIASGNSWDVMTNVLGLSASYNYSGYITDAFLFNLDTAQVSAHKLQTFGTARSGTILVGSHAYTIIGVSTDASGAETIKIRNPWGAVGPLGDSASGGYITLPVATARTNTQLYFKQN